MKVLLIDQIAKVNYKYTYPLANGLSKAKVDVELVIDQKKENENSLQKKYRYFITSDKQTGKIRKVYNYISSYFKIGKILKKGHYDVLHTEWYILSPVDYFFIKNFKAKYGVKYIATVHDILPFNEKFYDMNYHGKLYDLADSIILQAPINMQRFAELFPNDKNKTLLIPHGHMLDYVEYFDSFKARDILNIPEDKTVFLFFGQIKKVKGVDILLKAILELKKEREDFFVIIAGNVWKADFRECQEIIDDNNLTNILYTDIRYIPDEEIKYFYSAADVCVLPYTDVYQSGVIQLAYGYKKAVVSSNLPAFTQFVHDEETGYTFQNKNVNDLKEKMLLCLNNKDKLSQFGKNGYDLVKNKLNWDNLAKEIIEKAYKNTNNC